MNARRSARFALLVGCGLAAGPVPAVVNGVVVTEAEFASRFPWVVIVTSDGSPDSVCTGVLISRTFVLTAGHCTGSDRVVLWGSPQRVAARRVAVRESFRHPQYSSDGQVNDLGLLRLVRPLRVTPAPLASRAETWQLVRWNETATLTGWGHITANGGSRDHLHRTEIVFAGLQYAGTHIVFYSEASGPCGGDSGGPLLVDSRHGELLVAGIASVTDGNLCARGKGVSAYTDTAAQMDFIREHVTDLPVRWPLLD